MQPRHVHLVGIGGINMSAVAKLLRHADIGVSGSDAQETPLVQELRSQGISVTIGHAGAQIPAQTDLVIYSSAVPASNPERLEARRRSIRQMTNFQFLGEWTADKKTVLVTGTHGKSTTTAMLAEMLIRAGLDPSIVVGSKVPSFPEGNLRKGGGEWFVIEGDEYAKHFLEFSPEAVLINNIEHDHPDVFPTLEDVQSAFRQLLRRIRDGGLVVANADDPRVVTVVGAERRSLESRRVRIVMFGFGAHADAQITEGAMKPGMQTFVLHGIAVPSVRGKLGIPGRMNLVNAAGAATMALLLGASASAVQEAIEAYRGIWRRFEIVSDQDEILVVSDYGHHPTAVRANLEAVKAFYPKRRILLCFQPHHRNRTRVLFADFVASFDKADALVLAEVYDVAGRDDSRDRDVSSRFLLEAVRKRDQERHRNRLLAFAETPEAAQETVRAWKKTRDVIIIMGAGDIYRIAETINA